MVIVSDGSFPVLPSVGGGDGGDGEVKGRLVEDGSH